MINLSKINKLMKVNNINSYNILSKKAAIPYTTLLNIINNKDVRISSLLSLSNFFNVSIDDLIISKIYYLNIITEKYIRTYKLKYKNEFFKLLVLEKYLLS